MDKIKVTKIYKVKEEVLQDTLNYLSIKPFREVNGLIQNLFNSPVQEIPKDEGEKGKKEVK